jgi:hypothetical protein
LRKALAEAKAEAAAARAVEASLFANNPDVCHEIQRLRSDVALRTAEAETARKDAAAARAEVERLRQPVTAATSTPATPMRQPSVEVRAARTHAKQHTHTHTTHTHTYTHTHTHTHTHTNHWLTPW